ncbi:unnamed protein product [Adineta steineri]|uniref:RING-type domain-containing protein n=1 Tax=Adineta steineri TaxID=433720 RepID=A0A818VMS9_9BILA|nr:unnamed protein product [Adineta steineri]CAF3711802.1 unnamed protein product [Adineta steineri]
MSSSAIPMAINKSDEGLCEVCWEKSPINMNVITCAHRKAFCKNCIKNWLGSGNVYCPKCRTPWPVNINIDRENTDPCAVCWVEPPAYMDVIPCTHRKTFCQTCVEKVRAGDNVKCPMCRTPWSVNIYRENIDRNAVITVNERQTMEHHSLPPAATGGLMHDVLTCCVIGLLIGIIIYPIRK